MMKAELDVRCLNLSQDDLISQTFSVSVAPRLEMPFIVWERWSVKAAGHTRREDNIRWRKSRKNEKLQTMHLVVDLQDAK